MWDERIGWRWDVFGELLPLSIIKQIQSLVVAKDEVIEDSLYWHASTNGKCTIKSMIKIMKNPIDDGEQLNWSIVWNATAQNRVCFFLWLVMHDRVLCNTNRKKRSLITDARCTICGREDETLIHLLRDCMHAKSLWRRICPPRIWHDFNNTSSLSSWLGICLNECSDASTSNWRVLFPLAVWWLWKWRNDRVFSLGTNIPIDAVTFLEAKAKETQSALISNNVQALCKIQKHEQLITWCAPPYEWVALNTDGAAKGSPGPAGGGGVLRNCMGAFIAGFSLNLGHCTAMHAELVALWRGLELAWEKGLKKIDVRMDNQACVQIMNNNNNYAGPSQQIVRFCKDLIARSEWDIIISHCYREANFAVDWCANKGVNQDCSTSVFYTPL